MSVVVLHELYFGAYRSTNVAANLARLNHLPFEVLPLDANDAQHAGIIRAQLAAAGSPIGPYDVLIAAQAVVRERTLVTRNIREFERVVGLAVLNWES